MRSGQLKIKKDFLIVRLIYSRARHCGGGGRALRHGTAAASRLPGVAAQPNWAGLTEILPREPISRVAPW